MARLKQAYYGSCFVASCMHLQLKKVDPFITKRAHQILVVWAHGPIPYYSSEIPWYWLHLPEIMMWGHPPIAAIEAHDRKSTSWRQRIKSFRVAAGDDLWHAAQCRGHLHPRFFCCICNYSASIFHELSTNQQQPWCFLPTSGCAPIIFSSRLIIKRSFQS